MRNGIVKITAPVNEIDDFESVTVIGDPGCDGLGAGTMSVFARALNAGKTDFTLVVGDIVHRGIRPLYDAVTRFVDTVSPRPVYMLCGNHDTAHYEEFFGLRNYLLVNDHALFLFLDNSRRAFDDGAVEFLAESLENHRRKNIVVCFHFPAPNAVFPNSINPPEWEKVGKVLAPFRRDIRFLITGHVHSFFEADVDGMKMLVTGGGGARIEPVSDAIDQAKAHHHVLRLSFDGEGLLQYGHVPLENVKYDRELEDPVLREKLEFSMNNEAVASVRYRLFAEEAQEKGFAGIAKMFRAFSDSEFRHARNFFYALDRMAGIADNLGGSRVQEQYEINTLYREFLAYAEDHKQGLARYGFFDSLESEKVHERLLTQALEAFKQGRDIGETGYFTCTSCGYTFSADARPSHCPICGAPADRIQAVD